MKILMIAGNDIASTESLGVTKKIMGQFHAFQNLGCDAYCLCLKDGQGVLLHGEETKVLFPRQIKSYLAYVKLFGMADSLCKEYNIEMCYIRYPLADWVFMGMIRRLHKLCKVVVEIPTYPYDRQNQNIKNLVAQVNMRQDHYFRNKLKKYVDFISTFSMDKTIYGIPCINISNGIDVSQIKYLGDQLEYKDDIHLIGVARIQRDHGYDRIIRGMKEYYDRKDDNLRNIYFHVVGNGDAKAELEKLVIELRLQRNVLFYGVKTGAELEGIYSKCQIAVASLALFRSGISITSELKNREYCAIGIPFIGATQDINIPPNTPFYYRFLEIEDTPIGMEEIIKFYDIIKSNPHIHAEMRAFAESTLSWERQINKVLDSID